jgi:ATP synthase F1 complex assembly factor 2
MKKFWNFVALESVASPKVGFRILLDGSKPLKTPNGSQLLIPASQPILASLVAGEWEAIKTLKSYSVPLVIYALAND